MHRVLQFSSLWMPFVIIGVVGTRRHHRRPFSEGTSRPGGVACYRGLGPLRVTSISATDYEALVRLDPTADSTQTLQGFVVCLATGADEKRLLARWHRRRTQVWLQHDGSDDVIIFAGAKRVVLELWTESRAA